MKHQVIQFIPLHIKPKNRGKGARSYAAIFAVLNFSHKLLSCGKLLSSGMYYLHVVDLHHHCDSFPLISPGQKATSREFWYNHKTQQHCFRNQAEADSAVLDAASLLGVQRHELGIVGAAKGLLAGRFRFRVHGRGPDEHWQECETGTLIDSTWVSHTDRNRDKKQATISLLLPSDFISF